jgi:hypothetical protein
MTLKLQPVRTSVSLRVREAVTLPWRPLMSNSVRQVRLVIRQKIAFALLKKGLHVGDADCGRQRRHSASDLQRLESFLRTRSILPNGPLKCLATLLTHGSCA